LSINKSFKITERTNFQFFAEALNAFNTPSLASQATILTFASSGLISTAYTSATNNATTGVVTSHSVSFASFNLVADLLSSSHAFS
jgi:hypothetical protein